MPKKAKRKASAVSKFAIDDIESPVKQQPKKQARRRKTLKTREKKKKKKKKRSRTPPPSSSSSEEDESESESDVESSPSTVSASVDEIKELDSSDDSNTSPKQHEDDFYEHTTTEAVLPETSTTKIMCANCRNLCVLQIMQRDHIRARAYGGLDDVSNMQDLCANCHALKTNFEQTRFLKLKRTLADAFHKVMNVQGGTKLWAAHSGQTTPLFVDLMQLMIPTCTHTGIAQYESGHSSPAQEVHSVSTTERTPPAARDVTIDQTLTVDDALHAAQSCYNETVAAAHAYKTVIKAAKRSKRHHESSSVSNFCQAPSPYSSLALEEDESVEQHGLPTEPYNKQRLCQLAHACSEEALTQSLSTDVLALFDQLEVDEQMTKLRRLKQQHTAGNFIQARNALLKYMKRYFFVVESPKLLYYKMSINQRNRVVFEEGRDRKAFIESWAHIKVWNDVNQRKALSVAQMWLESPTRKTYNSMQFVPGQRLPYDPLERNNVFNTWTGFQYKETEGFVVDHAKIKLLTSHLRQVICNSDEKVFSNICKLFKMMLQGKKTGVALTILGNEGLGSYTFMRYIGEKIVGSDYYYPSFRMRGLGAKETALRCNRSLIVVQHMDPWANDADLSRLEQIVTEPTTVSKEKFRQAREVKDFANVVFLANDDVCDSLKEPNQCHCIVKISDAHANDENYFVKLALDYGLNGTIRGSRGALTDEQKTRADDIGLHFFHFLMQQDTSDFNPLNMRRTGCMKQLRKQTELHNGGWPKFFEQHVQLNVPQSFAYKKDIMRLVGRYFHKPEDQKTWKETKTAFLRHRGVKYCCGQTIYRKQTITDENGDKRTTSVRFRGAFSNCKLVK
jgi:5-methylcytosine-specific restriction endonuclease McrA